MVSVFKALYFRNRVFLGSGVLILLFILSWILPWLLPVSKVLLLSWIVLILVDIILLFREKTGLKGTRVVAEKLSNGDENSIQIYLENFTGLKLDLEVIDEIPFQFQRRDVNFHATVDPGRVTVIDYSLRPVKRGEYNFGALNVYAMTFLGLVSRRFRFSQDVTVPVYPSFLQLRKYEFYAISNQLKELGIKKIRRLGHNMEFEQIKEYIPGDDFRTINWKATARRGELMVNTYQDERSQQVYMLIDKGRVMKMPFEGMSLLDYSINASLVMANVALKKGDKAGIITFQHRVADILPASRRNHQMNLVLETLYNQKTAYKESDFSNLYAHVKQHITQRSLLLLFTNFEGLSSMERQLPYFRGLARNHLLVVIFFDNTELNEFANQQGETVRDIYHQVIAEKFIMEKKLIVSELQKHGIQSVLTTPENLTVDTINKYLELKSRNLI